jgi:hypothetical protein
MDKGNLTPRANTLMQCVLLVHLVNQFGSVLLAEVKQDGRLALTATWKMDGGKDNKEMTWTVELDNAQRNVLAEFMSKYQPKLYEKVE